MLKMHYILKFVIFAGRRGLRPHTSITFCDWWSRPQWRSKRASGGTRPGTHQLNFSAI